MIVQLDAPAKALTPVPPTVINPVPGFAVIGDNPPPQLLTTFGTAAITMPAGKVSVKVMLLRAIAPVGLVIVKVNVLVWPTPLGRLRAR